MVVSTQLMVLATSLTCVTTGGPHASVAVTDAGFGGGIAALQPNARLPGQVIMGGVGSLTMMDVEAVVVHPLASVMVTVYVPAFSPDWSCVVGPFDHMYV